MTRVLLTKDNRDKIVQAAYKLLGTPFCLNGNSKDTFNCSQFVTTVIHNAMGIDLPQKVDWLYIISSIKKPKELQIGDLVFFCRQPRPKGRIATHVAIYVGGGNIIHARQRAGKVVVEPITDFSETLITSKDDTELHQWLNEVLVLTKD